MTPEELRMSLYRSVQDHKEATVTEHVLREVYKDRLKFPDFSLKAEMQRLAKKQNWVARFDNKTMRVTFSWH